MIKLESRPPSWKSTLTALSSLGSLHPLLIILLQAGGRGFYARNFLWAPEITFWTLLPVQPKRELLAKTAPLM